MAGAAHNPEYAAKIGIPQSVAEEYNEADSKSGRLSQAMKSKSRSRKPKAPDGGGRAAKQYRQSYG